ncbi:MAG: Gmad2 immunoglobulin-like domain-containing protein, partial [Marmoricola sp.]
MTSPSNDDSELRRLLGDAVSDVHPQGGTSDIRARANRPSPTRWVPIVLAAAVATVVVIAGAGWLGQREPSGTPAAEPGSPSQTPDARRSLEPGRTETLSVFYVGETALGPRLFSERRTFTGVRGTDLEAAVQAAIGSPPRDPDYLAWTPSDGLTAQAELVGGRLVIDVSEALRRPAGMTPQVATMMLQALVVTAQNASETDVPAQFTVDGSPVPTLLGIDTSAPVPAASFDSVASPVMITGPTEGEVVGTEFTVEGMAATFEANVVWELRQDDKVVRNGFATAAECCTLSPYSFTVTAPPGTYTLVVHDTDESDGEGVGTSEDTKHGRVVGAPEMGRTKDFVRKDVALPRFRVEVWQ